MIEGEEVFDTAQETGYRLCSCPPLPDSTSWTEDTRLFSSQWDANDDKRLFLCSQDGLLKVLDTETGESRQYCIKFKKFFATGGPISNESTKNINYHWDKMITIPDRPHEIIFLLGVTKSLYYTALPGTSGPYPEEPFLTQTTRYDFSDFIYGTPIMELWSHTSRITSIAVSQFGHILASGDENGTIKLLMLRLLDDLSVSARMEVQKKKTKTPTFQQFLPEYKITLSGHKGPIFSMNWLPIVTENLDTMASRSYGLATGSSDGIVKIWRVTCSTRKGITINPISVLDTMTTSILCLDSYLDFNITSDINPKVRSFISKNIIINQFENSSQHMVNSGSTLSQQLNEKVTYKIKSKTTSVLESTGFATLPVSVFLSAGSDIGAIYIWKFDYDSLVDLIATGIHQNEGLMNRKHLQINNHKQEILLDDGKAIHSLLQSSQRPIIHITLTSVYDSLIDVNDDDYSLVDSLKICTSRTQRLVLVASDTHGVVRTHCEVDLVGDLYDKNASTNHGSKSKSRNRTNSVSSIRSESSRIRSNSLVSLQEVEQDPIKGPVTLCGESSFTSTVVSCSFQQYDIPKAVSKIIRNIQGNQSNVSNSILSKCPNLLVCTSDLSMQLFHANDLTSMSALRQDNIQTATEPTYKLSDSIPTTIERSVHNSSSLSNTNIDKVEDYLVASSVKIQQNHHKQQQQQQQQQQKDEVEEEINNNIQETYAIQSNIYSEETPLPIPQTIISNIQYNNISSNNVKSNQHDINYNIIKESNQVITNDIINNNNSIRSSTNCNNNDTIKSNSKIEKTKKTSLVSAVNHSTIKQENNKLVKESKKVIVESSQKVISKKNIDQNNIILEENKNKLDINNYSNNKIHNSVNDKSVVNSNLNSLLSTNQVNKVHESDQLKDKFFLQKPSSNSSNIPSSILAYPAVNSSNKLYQELVKISDKLNNDDITVTTIETTSSDRNIASNIVSNAYGKNRYSDLQQLLSNNNRVSSPTNIVTKPAIDPNWVAKKQLLGPTSKELHILYPSDPLISLHCNVMPPNNNSIKGQELRTLIDSNTLEPRYMMDLNIDNIFGSIEQISFKKKWKENQDETESMRDQSLLNSVSSHFGSTNRNFTSI